MPAAQCRKLACRKLSRRRWRLKRFRRAPPVPSAHLLFVSCSTSPARRRWPARAAGDDGTLDGLCRRLDNRARPPPIWPPRCLPLLGEVAVVISAMVASTLYSPDRRVRAGSGHGLDLAIGRASCLRLPPLPSRQCRFYWNAGLARAAGSLGGRSGGGGVGRRRQVYDFVRASRLFAHASCRGGRLDDMAARVRQGPRRLARVCWMNGRAKGKRRQSCPHPERFGPGTNMPQAPDCGGLCGRGAGRIHEWTE